MGRWNTSQRMNGWVCGRMNSRQHMAKRAFARWRGWGCVWRGRWGRIVEFVREETMANKKKMVSKRGGKKTTGGVKASGSARVNAARDVIGGNKKVGGDEVGGDKFG